MSVLVGRTMADHILYQIHICNARKRKSFSRWTVLKRFGQFYDMDQAVKRSLAASGHHNLVLPTLPQKKARFLTDHMDKSFVEQRRALLENYLRRMLHIVPVVRNKEFLLFLNAVDKDDF